METPDCPLLKPAGIHVGMTIWDAKKALLRATLKHTNNNKAQTARILGISAKGLYNLLHVYGLMDEFRSSAV